MFTRLVPVFLFLLTVSLASPPVFGQATGGAAEEDANRHAEFTRLLNRFVDDQGLVDYKALEKRADEVLVPYLKDLADADPSGWSRDARLAFWINAYNAYALKLIVDNYPVENIWATTPGPAEPKEENNPFGMKLGPVADTARTLDEIEHEIIRDRFDEPRIHFAVVCAAMDCPPLRQEAYTGSTLDDQLDDQGHSFLHNEKKNRIPADEGRIALSNILKWFMEDFGSSTDALQQYLASYFDGTVQERLEQADYEVIFESYDWSLNEQKEGATSASASD